MFKNVAESVPMVGAHDLSTANFFGALQYWLLGSKYSKSILLSWKLSL